MTRERLDAHTVESECWLFPCGLSLMIRIHEDSDAYLAIQTGGPTQMQSVPAAAVLADPSQDADLHQSSDSKFFVWRRLARLIGMCVALFEIRSQRSRICREAREVRQGG
jgi:hypothetical protein